MKIIKINSVEPLNSERNILYNQQMKAIDKWTSECLNSINNLEYSFEKEAKIDYIFYIRENKIKKLRQEIFGNEQMRRSLTQKGFNFIKQIFK